jgi:hypothetical protein
MPDARRPVRRPPDGPGARGSRREASRRPRTRPTPGASVAGVTAVLSAETAWRATAAPRPELPRSTGPRRRTSWWSASAARGSPPPRCWPRPASTSWRWTPATRARGPPGATAGFLLAGLAEAHHEVRARLGRERATALYRRTADALAATAQAHPGHGAPGRQPAGVALARGGRRRRGAAGRDARGRPARRALRRARGRGLLFPDDAAFQPLDRARELARRALAAGAGCTAAPR